MPEVKPKGKVKAKGLKGKLGPFPKYVWVLGGVLIVIGYLYYRKRRQTSTAGSQNQTVIPSGIISPTPAGSSSGSGNGYTTSTGNSGTDSTVTYPADYATTTDLGNAIDSINSETAKSIASITFPPPNINITTPPATVNVSTTASKTAAKKAAISSTPTKYFTLKKQVSLKAGQTLHYTKGKGYYAA